MAADASGSSAVEFSLVLPVFLLILFGILAYGTYFGASHSVAQLAADAARASVAGINTADSASLAKAHVAAHVREYSLLSASKVKVEAGPTPSDASAFKVTVQFDASGLPIWPLAAFVPLPAKTIERSAVVKRGGYCGVEIASC